MFFLSFVLFNIPIPPKAIHARLCYFYFEAIATNILRHYELVDRYEKYSFSNGKMELSTFK